MRIKNLVNSILNAEKVNQIYDFKFKDFSVWSYYRMYFYYKYAKDIGVLDESSSSLKLSFIYLFKILKMLNIYKLLKKNKYLILEHPRSNKDGYDIYTDDLVGVLGKENCSFFSFSQGGISNKKNNVILLDLLKIISKVASKLLYKLVKKDYFSNNYSNFLQELHIEDIRTYDSHYKRYYIEFVIQYYFYYYVLKLKKIDKAFVTIYYLNLPLVIACKNLKIEVIEIQHGVISKYHLGYHFPYYETDFFPDKIMFFSEYWQDVASYPKNAKQIVIGNSHLFTNQKDQIKKNKNTILIISQATIGKKLEKFIMFNIKFLNEYKIYFKLHPNEFNDKESKYKELLNINNVSVVTNEYTVNDLQNICEFQIGIYSTAIYEGIEKECKTILLKDTGIEYMDDLIEKNMVKSIDYAESLLDAMQNVSKPRKIIFFDKFKGYINGNK